MPYQRCFGKNTYGNGAKFFARYNQHRNYRYDIGWKEYITMFTTTSIYFLMVLLIFWCYSGYLILLLAICSLNSTKRDNRSDSVILPKVAIIVPCFNEEGYIKPKVENLMQLEYQENRYEVFFANAVTGDNTSKEIDQLIEDKTNWHLVETGCKGKVNQINFVLSNIRGRFDIILNTDMDALLSKDALINMVEAFNSNENIAVVGGSIKPANALHIEEIYWNDQNLLRIIESTVYTSSIVVAPCYAFKASLIDKFPEDCIADDIYIAFKANTDGYITKYIQSATGLETRTPETFSEFFNHKFRKGNAFLIELFRFFHRLPHMSGWWKTIYLTKFLQLCVMPYVLPFFVISTISLLLSGPGLFKMASFSVVFLFVTLFLTSVLIQKSRKTYLQTETVKKRYSIAPFILVNLILILVGFTYPFYRQSSSYKKVGTNKLP